MGRYAEGDELTTPMPQNDECEQKLEGNRRHDEEVNPRDACLTWLRRKVRQDCPGGRPRLTMYLATVDWATSIPSFNISP